MTNPSSQDYGRLMRNLLEEDSTDETTDLLVGQAAVEQGYVTFAQVEEGYEEQRRLRKEGQRKSLGQVLLEKAFLTQEQYDRVVPGRGNPVEQRLGKYILKREIARGGMGVIYEAFDPELKRRAALKVIHDDTNGFSPIARLIREATVEAQLRHPNIVSVYELGVPETSGEKRVHFIAMEYVEGRTLAHLLDLGDTPRTELLRILEDAARAVAYAHEHGVIHRDFKPPNIIIESGTGRVVLVDFGLARAEMFRSRLTRPQDVVGTPQYMAPEQIDSGRGKIDARTDVYSLGITLYEILTGRAPFLSRSVGEIYERVLNSDPIPPRSHDRTIPRDLEVICLKAIAKEPARRYPTALEFAEDLARFHRGEPIVARPSGWGARALRRIGRRKGLVASAGLAAAVAVLLVTAVARENAVHQARSRAERAYAAGDFARALAEAESGLERRADARMASIAADCRERIAEAERRRAVEATRVAPVLEKIQETNQLCYVPDLDLQPKLAELERLLADLEICAHEPGNDGIVAIWRTLGIGWYLVGDSVRAKAALERATALDSEDERVGFYLGRLLLEESVTAAMARAQEEMFSSTAGIARVETATYETAMRYLSRLGRGGDFAAEIDRQIAEGYRAFAKQDRSEVARICGEGLKRFPGELGSEEFYILLGMEKEVVEEAIDLYTKAVRRRPHYPWAYCARGVTRVQTGELGSAEADLTESIRQNPRMMIAYFHRGGVRKGRGNWDGAMEDFSRAVALDPAFVPSYLFRGYLRTQKGQWTEAIEDFSEAIRRNPDCATAFLNRGHALAILKKYAESVADYGRAIRLDPRDVDALRERGRVYWTIGKLEAAEQDFRTALGLAPDAPESWFNLGEVLRIKKDWDGAIQAFERALRFAPESSPGRAHVARSLEEVRKLKSSDPR